MSKFKEHAASGILDVIECILGDAFALLLIPIAILLGASIMMHDKEKKRIEEETFL